VLLELLGDLVAALGVQYPGSVSEVSARPIGAAERAAP
jgi:hypothetical protein